MNIEEIEISKIVSDKKNPRKLIEEAEELANSIQANGQLVPIEVEDLKNGQYIIVEGHRRSEAFRIIKKRTKKNQMVKCILSNKMSDADKLIKRAAIDAQMKNLSVEDRDVLWEKIWTAKKYESKEFADMLGVETSQVRHFLDRRSLTPKLREMFKGNAGTLQETIALEKGRREKVLKFAHKRGIGAMALRQEVKVLKSVSETLVDAFTNDSIDIEQVKELTKMDEKKQKEAIATIANTKKHIKNIPSLVNNDSLKRKNVAPDRVKSAQEFVDKVNDEVMRTSTKTSVLKSVIETLLDEKIADLWPQEVKEGVLEGLEELAKDMNEMKIMIDKISKEWRKENGQTTKIKKLSN